ncbi:hypothetical protein IGI04_031827 [Brassica rapa subsp. trilocularis]|uniref:Nucleoside phosphorylase domain-containing protein n=1 Tax=Brassica rapa subsp. trilocularis TaxID=1813537 RepID=A0ABQ7LUP5_BRACM|nr:hypothetical protein IGI04_031827 [Brassica rapa subsp. trilocularis]
MGPHGDGDIEKFESESRRRPISTVVFVIAMQAEAQPLVNKFGLSETTDSPLGKGLPWVLYHGLHKDLRIYVVCPGKDAASGMFLLLPLFITLIDINNNSASVNGAGIDSVGTVPASLITFASIQALQPDILINAGTCGAFKVKGANIGDVFLVSDVVFHDRRIPIPMFDLYGVGLRQAFSTPNLLKELNLKGAAVAYVAELLKVPVIFLKAVTDLIDGDKPTAEEFLQNLAVVTSALEETATKVINFIHGKTLSDL